MMAGEKRGQEWEKETGVAETGDGDGRSGDGGRPRGEREDVGQGMLSDRSNNVAAATQQSNRRW